MSKLLIILLITIFTTNLDEVQIDDYDNCIFIVVNDMYCKECLDLISENQDIWRDKLKTIIVRKSNRNLKKTRFEEKRLKEKIKFDELIFVESKARDFNQPIQFLDSSYSYTPILIVRKSHRDYYISYEYLFNPSISSESKARLSDTVLSVLQN